MNGSEPPIAAIPAARRQIPCRCGFDLRGRLVGERCPECGAPVTEPQPSGAWNDAAVRRRFAAGAWLALGVAPSVLPGVLVAWLPGFPFSQFWMIAVPPIACALAAVVMIDLGRPLPVVPRRGPGGVMLVGLIPLLALGCAIATTLDIGREKDTAGMAMLWLMLAFAAAMGVVAGRMRRQISALPSICAALAVVVAAVASLVLGVLYIKFTNDGDEMGLFFAAFGCMLLSVPLALLLAGAAFVGVHLEIRRRFGGSV